MQEALLPPAHPDSFHSAFGPKAFGPGDRRLSSPNLPINGHDLFYGCYSPFGPLSHFSSPSPPPSPQFTPLSRSSSSSSSFVDDGGDDAAATEHRLHLARLALQHQEVASRYEVCRSHLAQAAGEATTLRRENAQLRFANHDLARRISMVGGKQSSAIALADELRRVRLAMEAPPVPALLPPPPQPKMRPPAVAAKHAVQPKSISVRSTGYVKMNHGGRHRVSKPVNVGTQRVFVGIDGGAAAGGEEEQNGDGKKKKEARGTSGLELEVYNQGMYKTELCNKWEDTGACNFGDQCQFAHGIGELRPVIRHPRYKTEVCRIVLSGAVCPYGHRCHFRHALTPADRFAAFRP